MRNERTYDILPVRDLKFSVNPETGEIATTANEVFII